MVNARDALFMAKALRLAERGRGRTSPNPMVGALVVDGEGVVVGRGAHEVAGGPHAEIHALNEAGERAAGATLYCSLEPCSHTGRTGPCAPRVVQAGIARAVIATEDPNPLVAGRGHALLRSHGVHVDVGMLGAEAEQLNAAFFSVMRRERPYVTMKVALSLDGGIAERPGVRTAITGTESAVHAHRYRAEVDAVAVGSGTVLTDDPELTCRVAYRTRPLARVVFDRRLRTPPSARLLTTLDTGPVIIATSRAAREAAPARVQALQRAGAALEVFDGGVPLTAVLQRLARGGIGSLLVEGGASLHGAFWNAGLVDRVQMYVAPRALGPAAMPWVPEPVISAPCIAERNAQPLGDDILIEGHVHWTR